MFSCEFCEIPKNNFFTEHLLTTASNCRLKNKKFKALFFKAFRHNSFMKEVNERAKSTKVKSMEWFLYDRDLRYEIVNYNKIAQMFSLKNDGKFRDLMNL